MDWTVIIMAFLLGIALLWGVASVFKSRRY
jgi:hypothetical protein